MGLLEAFRGITFTGDNSQERYVFRMLCFFYLLSMLGLFFMAVLFVLTQNYAFAVVCVGLAVAHNFVSQSYGNLSDGGE